MSELAPQAKAAYDGDLEHLKLYIRSSGIKGANYVDQSTKMSLLSLAVMSNNPKAVRFLLSKKARPTFSNPGGMTPIMLASKFCKLEAAQVLIESNKLSGEDLSVKDSKEYDALMHCCYEYNQSKSKEDREKFKVIAKLLISSGIDLKQRDKLRRSALHIAIEEKCVEISKIIIESDRCELTMKDNKRDTPLILASKNGQTKITELLVERLNNSEIDTTNAEGDTAFTAAAAHGNVRQLKLLQMAGADIFHRNRRGLNAIGVAQDKANRDAIRFLERLYNDKKANLMVRQKTNMESDPAFFDEMFGLIKNNIRQQFQSNLSTVLNVDALSDKEGHEYSLLMAAAKHNRIRLIQDLVNAEANLDLCDRIGKTALHYVVEEGSVDSVLKLLNCQANPNIQEFEHGYTPLMMCSKTKRFREEIVRHFLTFRADLTLKCRDSANTAAHLAVVHNKKTLLNLLLEGNSHCVLSSVNERKETPLLLAVKLDKKEAIRTLALYTCRCPEHQACNTEHLEHCDLDGNTAFSLAASLGHLDIVQLLERSGANFKHRNRSGMEPIDLAGEAGHSQVVEYISKLKRTWRYPSMLLRSKNEYRGDCVYISVSSDSAHELAVTYDGNRLLNLFQTKLRFKFRPMSNPSAKEMQKYMQDIANEDHSRKASFICVVSAHGYSDEETKRTYIEGRDSTDASTESATKQLISVENLIDPITKCATLKGKPKIFFIQCCRCQQSGLRDRAVRTPARGARGNNQRDLSDLLQVYSTSSGDVALRTLRGTVFIQKLCAFIENYMEKHHLREIIDKLAASMNDEPVCQNLFQTIEIRGNLPKKMYFHDEELPRESEW